MSLTISNSWSASVLTSSKFIFGRFLYLKNESFEQRLSQSMITYSLIREGCESSSPPIIIRPFNLTFPVKLNQINN